MITINGLEPSYSLFPNNEYNLVLSPSILKSLKGPAEIVWNFEQTDELFKLGMLLSTLEVTDTNIAHVLINYLPYSRMDRHDSTNPNPLSLQVLVNMLPEFKNGLVHYTFESVHNPKALKTFLDGRFGINNFNVTYTIEKPRELDKLEEVIKKQDSERHHTLVIFPDKGSIERYKGYIKFKNPSEEKGILVENSYGEFSDGTHFMYAYGEKKRDFETHKIYGYELLQANGNTFDYVDTDFDSAVIVDDVVSFGGTFIKILNELESTNKIKNVTLIAGNIEDSIFRGDLLTHPMLTQVLTYPGLTKHTSSVKVVVNSDN